VSVAFGSGAGGEAAAWGAGGAVSGEAASGAGAAGYRVSAADLAAAADLFRHQQKAACAAALPPSTSSSSSSDSSVAATPWCASRSTRILPHAITGSCPSDAAPNRGSPAGGAAGWGVQFTTLLRRELLLITRNPADVAGRTLSFVWTAALVGFCFYSMPDSAAGVRGRLNILFSSLCFLLLMPFLSTSLLASGKAAYVRDVAAGVYSPLPYYAAKVRPILVRAGTFGLGGLVGVTQEVQREF